MKKASRGTLSVKVHGCGREGAILRFVLYDAAVGEGSSHRQCYPGSAGYSVMGSPDMDVGCIFFFWERRLIRFIEDKVTTCPELHA